MFTTKIFNLLEKKLQNNKTCFKLPGLQLFNQLRKMDLQTPVTPKLKVHEQICCVSSTSKQYSTRLQKCKRNLFFENKEHSLKNSMDITSTKTVVVKLFGLSFEEL